jgi:DNA polymerase III delta prime subunit
VSPEAAVRLPLAERLRPARLDDIVGNPRARADLRAWAETWKPGRVPARRASILIGPPGVGKTTAALAIAAEMGWTVVEMNASDARNQSAIERVAGRASISHTLGEYGGAGRSRRALLLLDEADCLSGRPSDSARSVRPPPPLGEFLRGRYGTVGALNAAWGLGTTPKTRPFADWSAVPRSPGNAGWGRLPEARRDIEEWRAAGKTEDTSDRGGWGAISKLVRATLQPLILTVNDDRALTRYSPAMRAGLVRIRFSPIRDEEVARRLEEVARAEGLSVRRAYLDAIVGHARGDLRAALNDLDAVVSLPSGVVPPELAGSRDLASDFADFAAEVLTSARYYRSGEIRDRLDAPPDDLLPWIEENIPHFAPDAEHRDRAFAVLAASDRLLVRARRARVYGLWSYAGELLTGGVGLALHDQPVRNSGGADFPRFLGEMGQSRSSRALRDSVATKLGKRAHLSRAKARAIAVPFVEGLVAVRPGTARSPRTQLALRALVSELELTEEEVGYVLGTSADAVTVRELRDPGTEPTEEDTTAEDDEDASRSASSRPPKGRPPDREKKSTQRSLGDFER